MLVEFETTTEKVASVLHDLTAKIVRQFIDLSNNASPQNNLK